MELRECVKSWECVLFCYEKTTTPGECVEEIKKVLGIDKALEVFATVVRLHEGDGRIENSRRLLVNTVPVNPDACILGSDMCYAGIDKIHMSHVDTILSGLLRSGGYSIESVWDGDCYSYHLSLKGEKVFSAWDYKDILRELKARDFLGRGEQS